MTAADFRAADIAMRISLITGGNRRGVRHAQMAQHQHKAAGILHLHALIIKLEQETVAVNVLRHRGIALGIERDKAEVLAEQGVKTDIGQTVIAFLNGLESPLAAFEIIITGIQISTLAQRIREYP